MIPQMRASRVATLTDIPTPATRRVFYALSPMPLSANYLYYPRPDMAKMVDNGYDPATNKVQGVVLVDTTTANTDMRGTDSSNTTTPQISQKG